jgi:hypothetical protein
MMASPAGVRANAAKAANAAATKWVILLIAAVALTGVDAGKRFPDSSVGVGITGGVADIREPPNP